MKTQRVLFLFGIAAALALFLRAFAVEGIYVATGSMEPTLPVDAHLFLDKITYRFRRPQRGEIVIFRAPVPPYVDMGKRIIAMSGDTIELRDKKVFLNGAPQEEPYVKHTRAQERLKGDNLGPVTVPEGYVFLLGDNRDESDDSSVWTDPKTGEPIYFVPLSSVRGILRGFY